MVRPRMPGPPPHTFAFGLLCPLFARGVVAVAAAVPLPRALARPASGSLSRDVERVRALLLIGCVLLSDSRSLRLAAAEAVVVEARRAATESGFTRLVLRARVDSPTGAFTRFNENEFQHLSCTIRACDFPSPSLPATFLHIFACPPHRITTSACMVVQKKGLPEPATRAFEAAVGFANEGS